MSYIKKIIKSIMTPRIFIRKVIHRLPNGSLKKMLIRFPNEESINRQLNELRAYSKGRKVFIFPIPACPWGYMFQRPQQLARALAEKGHIVIYMVDTSYPYSPDWDVRGLLQIDSNLYLYNDNNEGKFLRSLGEEIIVWQYWPHQRSFISCLKSEIQFRKIYDCIDHITTFISYPGIKSDFINSIKEADIVLTTAKELRNEISLIRPDCILIPNAVRLNDFLSFRARKWDQLQKVRENASIIVGYYGAIAEWFDFDIMNYIAKSNPMWTFLLVGEVYPCVESKVIELRKNKNITILPRVPYSDIPQLLSSFDIAILPFILNSITVSTSPVKVFEYLAGGKLTVSSDLPEIRGLPGVFIARNPEEFNMKLYKAYSLKDDLSIKQEMQETVKVNTWKKRTEIVLSELDKRQRDS